LHIIKQLLSIHIPFQQCPSLEKVILPAYCDLEVFWPELEHGLGHVEEISFNPQNEENLTLFNMKHVTGPIFL
jgi:hypothetical protein